MKTNLLSTATQFGTVNLNDIKHAAISALFTVIVAIVLPMLNQNNLPDLATLHLMLTTYFYTFLGVVVTNGATNSQGQVLKLEPKTADTAQPIMQDAEVKNEIKTI